MIKLKAPDKKQRIELTEVKLKTLTRDNVKEDIWTLSGESILNVKYHITEDKLVIRPLEKAGTHQPKMSNKDFKIKIDLEEIMASKEKSPERPKLQKKLSFLVPDSFKGRDKKKQLTTKNIFHMDILRSAVLGKKDSIKNESTLPSSTLSNSLLQYTRLEYDNIELEKGEVFEADTFADVFFICGLPKVGAKVISDSQTLEAPCKHKDCGIFRSYRPDILHRFPHTNYKSLNLCSSVLFYNFSFQHFVFQTE